MKKTTTIQATSSLSKNKDTHTMTQHMRVSRLIAFLSTFGLSLILAVGLFVVLQSSQAAAAEQETAVLLRQYLPKGDKPDVSYASVREVQARQNQQNTEEIELLVHQAHVLDLNTPISITAVTTGLLNVSYDWDWGDGTPAETSIVDTNSHVYTQAGEYTISVTATDLDSGTTVVESILIRYGDLILDAVTYVDPNMVATYLPSDGLVSVGDTIIPVASVEGFFVGDDVVVATMDNPVRAGTFETATITAISANSLSLQTQLLHEYNGADSIVVQRIPRYNTVHIPDGAELTAPNWGNNQKGGFVGLYAGQIYVAENGAISVDGKGFEEQNGPGAGRYHFYSGTGAGHSSPGGDAYARQVPGTNPKEGGVTYGEIYHPLTMGSGGGSSQRATNGGNGGGIIYLSTNQISLLGRLSSMGENGRVVGALHTSGGGSGGSVFIQTNQFTGDGIIDVSGGDANWGHGSNFDRSGQGSGGRIAIYMTTNDFVGDIYASSGGGNGYPSGEGTVYLNLVDPLQSTIEAKPDYLPTGQETTLLTVTLRQTDGSVVAHHPVSISLLTDINSIWDASGNLLNAVQDGRSNHYLYSLGTTNAKGEITGTMSSTVANDYLITAWGGFVRVITPTFVTFEASAPAVDYSVLALEADDTALSDGVDSIQFRATIRDQFSVNNAVSDTQVSLVVDSTNPVTVTPLAETTNVNGQILFDLTSDFAQTATVTAILDDAGGEPLLQTFEVTFVGTDLVVSTSGPSQASVRSQVVWQITAANNGHEPAADVVIAGPVPNNFVLSPPPETSEPVSYDGSGQAIWSVGALDAGESRTLVLTATLEVNGAIGPLAIDVVGTTSSYEIWTDNNSATYSLNVLPISPELEVSSSADSLYLPAGVTDYLTITVENVGDATANQVVITPHYDWITPAFPAQNLAPGAVVEHVYQLNAPLVEGLYIDEIDIRSDEVTAPVLKTEIFVGDYVPQTSVFVTNTAGLSVTNAEVNLEWHDTLSVWDNGSQIAPQPVTASGVSNLSGELAFNYLPSGSYILTISADKHEPYEAIVAIYGTQGQLEAVLEAYPTIVFEPSLANVNVVAGQSAVIQVQATNTGPGIARNVELEQINLAYSWMSLALPDQTEGFDLAPGESIPLNIFLNPPLDAAPADGATTYQVATMGITADNLATKAVLPLQATVTHAEVGSFQINVEDKSGNPVADTKMTLISQTPRQIITNNGPSATVVQKDFVADIGAGASKNDLTTLATDSLQLLPEARLRQESGNESPDETTDWQVVFSGADGIVTIEDLVPGAYTIYAEREDYYAQVGYVDVQPGDIDPDLGINYFTIILDADPFAYKWEVTETEIEDTYLLNMTIGVNIPPEDIETPAVGVSSEKIFSCPDSQSPSGALLTPGVARIQGQVSDQSGSWLIANMGSVPLTNLTFVPTFSGVEFDVNVDDIPEVLNPRESVRVGFTVNTYTTADQLPREGEVVVYGDYFLYEEWHRYQNSAPIFINLDDPIFTTMNYGSGRFSSYMPAIAGNDCSSGGNGGPGSGGSVVSPSSYNPETNEMSNSQEREEGEPFQGPPEAGPPPIPGTTQQGSLSLGGRAFLTRQAFDARLSLLNLGPESLDFEIDMRAVNDETGDAIFSGGFSVDPALPTKYTLAGEDETELEWLMVPTNFVTDPAGDVYNISAVMIYTPAHRTESVTRMTFAQPVTIYPQPQVRLSGSHNQPNSSGEFYIEVVAENDGYGVARDLSIDMSNVRIMPDLDGDSQNVSFRFVRGEVIEGPGTAGRYTFDFTDLGPGEKSVGRWYLKVSSSGEKDPIITGFSLSCEHQDYQGVTLSPLIVNCGEQIQTYFAGDCPFCTISGRVINFGGPINSYNGNHDFSQSTPSVSTVGTTISLIWTYNSLNTGIAEDIAKLDTPALGLGWSHNHMMRLEVDQQLGALGGVRIYAPKGTPMVFEEIAGGRFRPAVGILADLSYSNGIYTLKAHEQSVFTFNDLGQFTSRTDPQGNVTDYGYNLAGQLETITDRETGRALTLAYNGDGRLYTVTDPIDRVTTFNYDVSRRLSGITDARLETWRYTYESVNNVPLLRTVFDPEDRIVEETGYDDIGRAITQTFRGQEWEIEYRSDSQRVITKGVGIEANATLLVYNNQGLLVATSNIVDNKTQEFALLTHSSDQTLDSGVDKNGNVTKGDRTSDGYPLSMTNALSQTITYDYDDHNNLTSMTDALNRTTRYEYDEQNNLITVTNPLDHEQKFDYNATGQLLRQEDAVGNTIEYEYDSLGQVIAIVNTSDLVTRYAYDDVGRLITTTNPFGKVTVNQYDSMNNIVQIIENYLMGQKKNHLNEYNIITQYNYDSAGYRTVMTDTLGRVSLYFYDDAGRLTLSVENYDGTPYSSDPQSELCGFPAPVNPSSEFNICSLTTYDSASRVVANTDNIGRINRTFYDEQGRMAGSVNHSVDVDELEKLASCYILPTTREQDSCTTYEYDAMGNTLVVTDTIGDRTRFVYDDLNRKIATIHQWDGTDPEWLIANYLTLPKNRTNNLVSQTTFDAVGNTLLSTDTIGRMSMSVYDKLNRMQGKIQNWDGTTDPQIIVDNCQSLDPLREENLCTTYSYDKANRQITSTDGLGRTSRNVYNPDNGRLIASIQNWDGTDPYALVADFQNGLLDPNREVNIFGLTEYNELTGQRIATIDVMGERTEYEYDSLGRSITTTRYVDGEPLRTVSVYDVLGNVTNRIDAKGNSSTTFYDNLNRAYKTLSAEGVAITTTFDALGRPTGTVNNLGHTTITVYDGLGRVTINTNAENETSRQSYTVDGKQIATTDANNIQTAFVYDELGRQTHIIENWDGRDVTQIVIEGVNPTGPQVNLITTYNYSVEGNRLSTINTRGYTTTQTTYDHLNRAITVQNALTTSIHTTKYNVLGQTVTMTDANGARTEYEYDELYRIKQIFYAENNETVEYAYNVRGQKRIMTDSLGTTNYLYDSLGRLIEVTDPFGATVHYDYNENGQRERLTYPDGKEVNYQYDDDKRLETVIDWNNEMTAYDYDSAGRLITTTLGNGTQVLNRYDKANRLTSMRYVAASGDLLAEFIYSLDSIGNRTAVTETLYAPDRVEEISRYLEENGKLVLEAEDGIAEAGTTHDWVEEVSQTGFAGESYVRGLPEIGRSFDTSVYNPGDQDYLGAHHIVVEESPILQFPIKINEGNNYRVWVRGSAPDSGSDAVHISLEGDSDNPLVSAGGASYLTGFDRSWNWSSVTESNSQAMMVISPGEYTLNVALKEDGVRVDQVMLITDTTYIPDTEISTPLQVISSTTTTNEYLATWIDYSYDNRYQLTKATYTGAISATFVYSYDLGGNMVAHADIINGETAQVNRFFNQADQLISSTDLEQGGTTTYIYDYNGNMVQVLPPQAAKDTPVTRYTFDQRNLIMVTEVDKGQGYITQATFAYSGEGVRYQQVDYTAETATTITYVNDLGHDPVPVLIADDGDSIVTNLYGLGLMAQDDSGLMRYLLVDALGSVRLEMTGSTRNDVESVVTRDPYGNTIDEQGSQSTAHGYTGELEDNSTGLIYLRARYYNPRLKLFLSRDPFAGWDSSPASQHPYSYVHNNPTMFTDPSGESIAAVIIGGIIVAGVTGVSYDIFVNQGITWDTICNADWRRGLTVGGLMMPVGAVVASVPIASKYIVSVTPSLMLQIGQNLEKLALVAYIAGLSDDAAMIYGAATGDSEAQQDAVVAQQIAQSDGELLFGDYYAGAVFWGKRTRNFAKWLTDRKHYPHIDVDKSIESVANYPYHGDTIDQWIDDRWGTSNSDYNCAGAVLCEYRLYQGRAPLTEMSTSNDVNLDLIMQGLPSNGLTALQTHYRQRASNSIETMQRGDLIAWHVDHGYISHLGIYLGDGLIFYKMSAGDSYYFIFDMDTSIGTYGSEITVWEDIGK